MSDRPETINIVKSRLTRLGAFVRIVVFCTLIVGSSAISHMFLGGGWLADVLLLVLALIAFVTLTRRQAGLDVDMTRDELRDWVADDMPEDVNAWRDEMSAGRVIERRRRPAS